MTPARLGPGWWLVAVGTAVAILIASLGSLRAGGFTLAAVLVLAAALRLTPSSVSDGLAVRSRLVDVVTLLVFATAVVVIFAIVSL